MSEEHPPPGAVPDDAPEPPEAGGTARGARDADAWATACEEDLRQERARHRERHGPPPGSAAEELRRLVDTVADRLSSFQPPLLGQVGGPAAQHLVRQAVRQAKAAVDPVIERNPDVFDHLAAAGGELLAAYRSAVQGQEKRWTTGAQDPDQTEDGGEGKARDTDDPGGRGGEGDTGAGGPRRIDLD
ncbi:DUF5304 domain-containing protein [Streptomyces sp. ZYX-F-203]